MVPSFLPAGAGAGVPLLSRHSEELRFALRGMVPSPTPKRDHGDPQTFRLRSEGKGSWHAGGYSSGSVGDSSFFAFFRLMLIAAASRLFLRWDA
jgi:hypothetical protein